VRHIYQVHTVLALTGLTWQQIVPFIPDPLKPVEWDRFSEEKRKEFMVLKRWTFARDSVETMIRQICREYSRMQTMQDKLDTMTFQQHQSNVILLEIRSMMSDHKEYFTLRDLAKKFNMNYGTLRNKIYNRRMNGEVQMASIEARGFVLTLWKNLKGQWMCDALEFRNQWKKISMRAALKIDKGHYD